MNEQNAAALAAAIETASKKLGLPLGNGPVIALGRELAASGVLAPRSLTAAILQREAAQLGDPLAWTAQFIGALERVAKGAP